LRPTIDPAAALDSVNHITLFLTLFLANFDGYLRREFSISARRTVLLTNATMRLVLAVTLRRLPLLCVGKAKTYASVGIYPHDQISPTYDALLTTGQSDNSRNGLDWHTGC